jgi:hypothetical protein
MHWADRIVFRLPEGMRGVEMDAWVDPAARTARVDVIVSRRRGYGSAAVRAFEAWALENGAQTIRGDAIPSSAGFWRRLGYRTEPAPPHRTVPFWKRLAAETGAAGASSG